MLGQCNASTQLHQLDTPIPSQQVLQSQHWYACDQQQHHRQPDRQRPQHSIHPGHRTCRHLVASPVAELLASSTIMLVLGTMPGQFCRRGVWRLESAVGCDDITRAQQQSHSLWQLQQKERKRRNGNKSGQQRLLRLVVGCGGLAKPIGWVIWQVWQAATAQACQASPLAWHGMQVLFRSGTCLRLPYRSR